MSNYILDAIKATIEECESSGMRVLPPLTKKQIDDKAEEIALRNYRNSCAQNKSKISEADAMDRFYSRGNTKD